MSTNRISQKNDIINAEANDGKGALDSKRNISYDTKLLVHSRVENRTDDDCVLSLVSNRSIVAVSLLNNTSSILRHGGSGSGSLRNNFSLMGSLAEFESLRELPIDRTSILQSTKFDTKLSLTNAIKTRTSISVFTSGFFLAFGLMALLQHLPAFAENIGLQEEQGTKILSWARLTMIIGNIGFGFAVDYCGPIWMLRLLLLILTVSF